MSHYHFEYQDTQEGFESYEGERYPDHAQIINHFEIDSDAPWSDVLKGFLSFLGTVYGYPVHDKVRIEK